MNHILVFGHKNPDTDAVTSAISFSHLQQELGYNTEPIVLGALSDETLYALNYFETDTPRMMTTLDPETDVMLVDHNETQQSIEGIESATVRAVIDHHRIANFNTAEPLYYRAEPVGCTNTIILKLYKEHNITIPKHIAGLMLSAIISDTLLFKSPTCTPEDKQAAYELATIAEVDVNQYGMALLKAGTNLKNKSIRDILEGDAKCFDMGGKKVRIGQVNVVDVQEVLERKSDLIEEALEQHHQYGYDLTLLLITDILSSDSIGLVVGDYVTQVSQAFATPVEEGIISLPGVVSRKKQIVPQLTNAFD